MNGPIKSVYMIGGPNGAGKTTLAMELLPNFLEINEFVNADNIANGLSPFNPDSMAITAGKLMLTRIKNLIEEEKSFAFETTCAGRNHLQTLKKCKDQGYETNLIFLWLASTELAIQRVASRVKQGGHNIPANIVSRRYKSGLRNLLNIYIPFCDVVTVYDCSEPLLLEKSRDIIVSKEPQGICEIRNKNKWKTILEAAS
jgi:predicted ABC-type ATPase